MRHQFFGGPLHGKVLLLDVLLGDQELRENVPWEEYDRFAINKSSDGVVDIVQWRHRDEVPASAVPAPIKTDGMENAYSVPPLQPVEGGQPLVKHMKDPEYEGSHRIPQPAVPVELPDADARRMAVNAFFNAWVDDEMKRMGITSMADFSKTSEGKDIAMKRNMAHQDASYDYMSLRSTVDPEQASSGLSVASDDTETEVRVIDQLAQQGAAEVIQGDGQNIWETFESRRKALKISRDRLGTDLGGTKSLGWRLESGNVSNGDVKKLGLNSIEDVYAAAHALLLRLETDA